MIGIFVFLRFFIVLLASFDVVFLHVVFLYVVFLYVVFLYVVIWNPMGPHRALRT